MLTKTWCWCMFDTHSGPGSSTMSVSLPLPRCTIADSLLKRDLRRVPVVRCAAPGTRASCSVKYVLTKMCIPQPEELGCMLASNHAVGGTDVPSDLGCLLFLLCSKRGNSHRQCCRHPAQCPHLHPDYTLLCHQCISCLCPCGHGTGRIICQDHRHNRPRPSPQPTW